MPRPLARIERAENGFEVEMCDPKLKEKNGEDGPYVDPYVSFVFNSVEEVVEFLTKNLDKAVPMDEYETSFDSAVKESKS